MKHSPQAGNALVFVLASPYVSFILLFLQVLLKTTRKGLLLGLHFLLLVGVFVACGGLLLVRMVGPAGAHSAWCGEIGGGSDWGRGYVGHSVMQKNTRCRCATIRLRRQLKTKNEELKRNGGWMK